MDELQEIPIPDPGGPDAPRFRRQNGASLQILCKQCGNDAITIAVAAAEPYQDRATWTLTGPFRSRKLGTPDAWKLFQAIQAASLADVREALSRKGASVNLSTDPGDPACQPCREIYCPRCWSIEWVENWGGMDVGCGGVISRATCPQGHAFTYQSDGWSYG